MFSLFGESLLPPWLQLVVQRRFLSAAAAASSSGGGSGGDSGGAAVSVRRQRRLRAIEDPSHGSDLEFVPGGSWLSSDSDSNGSDLEGEEFAGEGAPWQFFAGLP